MNIMVPCLIFVLNRIYEMRIGRILFIIGLLAAFSWAAFYLFLKQQTHYSYRSFTLPDQHGSVFIPDIDRLIRKIDVSDEMEVVIDHDLLRNGITKVLSADSVRLNKDFGKSCYISWSSDNFVLAFQYSAGPDEIVEKLSEQFSLDFSVSENNIIFNNTSLTVGNYGDFTCLSLLPFEPDIKNQGKFTSNADYTVYSPDNTQGTHHILSGRQHFSMWEEETAGAKGKPLFHQRFFERVPLSAQVISFYGSARLNEDVRVLFPDADTIPDDAFNWVDQGLIIFRKDSFQLLVAPQNTDRDLRLMLEEQTLKAQGDTGQINSFNISSYEITPFESDVSWQNIISELDDELRFFTEYLNFNVMANSIPAMRWYLGELQMGSMYFVDAENRKIHEEMVPQLAHYIRIDQSSGDQRTFDSGTWLHAERCTYTRTSVGSGSFEVEGLKTIAEMLVEIQPSRITVIKDTSLILINNSRQLVMYEHGVKKWRLDLSTPLVKRPQVVDFENDGSYEIVMLQANQMDVVDHLGKSLPGYPVMFNGTCGGGLAVNYDNQYDFRLLVNVGNQVISFNEAGKKVDGWMFTGMDASLKDEVVYHVAGDKDIISFSDQTNRQYVLSRRGDFRFPGIVRLKTDNTAPFILGQLENSSLRKMGFKNPFIYNYYMADGSRDSVKLDMTVSPKALHWEYNDGHPVLIIEEENRVLEFSEFGYLQSEVLKPAGAFKFVGRLGNQDSRYVFADNSQNNLYLLNGLGKMMTQAPVQGSAIYAYEKGWLYTFVGSKLMVYKIE